MLDPKSALGYVFESYFPDTPKDVIRSMTEVVDAYSKLMNTPAPDAPKTCGGKGCSCSNPDPDPDPPYRGEVLKEAHRIINGERQDAYGSPEDSFALIAQLWNAYLCTAATRRVDCLSARDVAILMILFKVARLANNLDYKDGYTDICGYAALASEMK